MSKKRLCVCIVLEGSYPYITGGVSAWVHDLIINLPEVDFKLFTISPEANQPLRYKLPVNVIESRDILIGAPPGTVIKEPRKKIKLLKEVWRFHQNLEAGRTPDTRKMIGMIPENSFLYHLAVKSRIGWKMITQGNRKNNPLYPVLRLLLGLEILPRHALQRSLCRSPTGRYLSCRVYRICWSGCSGCPLQT